MLWENSCFTSLLIIYYENEKLICSSFNKQLPSRVFIVSRDIKLVIVIFLPLRAEKSLAALESKTYKKTPVFKEVTRKKH